jgi:hypothetical protein
MKPTMLRCGSATAPMLNYRSVTERLMLFPVHPLAHSTAVHYQFAVGTLHNACPFRVLCATYLAALVAVQPRKFLYMAHN